MSDQECEQYRQRGFDKIYCRRKAKVHDPGGWRCGIHSDEAVARRRAKSDEKYRAYVEGQGAKRRARERLAAADKAMAAYESNLATEGQWHCDFCDGVISEHKKGCPYSAWKELKDD